MCEPEFMEHSNKFNLYNLPTFQEKQLLILKTWGETYINRNLTINTLVPNILGQNKHLIQARYLKVRNCSSEEEF